MTNRFFVGRDSIDGRWVSIVGAVARQMNRVLRLRPGHRIIVLDNSGWEYSVVLDHLTDDKVLGTVESRNVNQNESRLRIAVFQSVLKSDRFEFVLQKCTELGVVDIVPVLSDRTVRRLRHESRVERRTVRWQRVIKEAAEQSHRGRIPTLGTHMEFEVACQEAKGLSLIPWEEEQTLGIKEVLRDKKHSINRAGVSVFIGPEGGFTSEEISQAKTHGIIPVSLGRRILRSDTAAIVAVTSIFHENDDFG